MITTTKTTRGLIVTICQYDFYQNGSNYEQANDYATNTTAKTIASGHYKQECIKNNKNEKGYPSSSYFLLFTKVKCRIYGFNLTFWRIGYIILAVR